MLESTIMTFDFVLAQLSTASKQLHQLIEFYKVGSIHGLVFKHFNIGARWAYLILINPTW